MNQHESEEREAVQICELYTPLYIQMVPQQQGFYLFF